MRKHALLLSITAAGIAAAAAFGWMTIRSHPRNQRAHSGTLDAAPGIDAQPLISARARQPSKWSRWSKVEPLRMARSHVSTPPHWYPSSVDQ